MFGVLGVLWASLAASSVVRRLWPASRRIPLLLRANLAAGGAALLLVALLGRDHLARELAWAVFSPLPPAPSWPAC